MFLKTSRLHLTSLSLTPFRVSRPLLRLCNQSGQRISETPSIRSRSAASKVQLPSKRIPPKKPLSAATPRRLGPQASEARDTQHNLLAENLARDGKSVLFKAACQTGYMWSAWMPGVICICGVFLILSTNLYAENAELHWFVPVAYRMSAIVLVAIGSWSILRSSSLLSSIEILPGKDQARLLFKIRRNVPLPFIKPREIIASAADVTLERKIVTFIGSPILEASRLETRDGNIVIRIARRISLAVSRFFAGARQFMVSEGIIYLHIKDHRGRLKLDANGLHPEGGPLFLKMVKYED
jgi:hypothetical protein